MNYCANTEEYLDVDALWEQFKTDKQVKKDLVMHYLYLVNKIVMRMMPSYSGYVDADDLISCGIIGLMDAIDKYSPEMNTDFEVFSKRRIAGEIIDSLRKMDWASVSLRNRIKQMNTAIDELHNELGREPDDEEISTRMGVSVEKILKLKAQVHLFNIVHFESIISDNDSNSVTVGDLVKDDNTHDLSDDLEKKEFEGLLAERIEELNEKEQFVIKLYYYEELKFKEIAAILDVTESRVSQIHSNALAKLRKGLSQYNDSGDDYE